MIFGDRSKVGELLRLIMTALFVSAISGCMQLNTAGVIDNIGREYKAVLVEKEKTPRARPCSPQRSSGDEMPMVWDACEADGKCYIKARMALIRESNVWLREAAFCQLPHKDFCFDGHPGDICYFHKGQIITNMPEYAVGTTVKPQSVYPFYTVYPAQQLKHPKRYEPLWMEEQPNPHRVYTAPLSWVAAVLVDLPGSIVCSAVALPVEIYSALFD